jgi:hypothetical protein
VLLVKAARGSDDEGGKAALLTIASETVFLIT